MIIDENKDALNTLIKGGFQYFYLEKLNEIIIADSSSSDVILQRLTWNGAIVNIICYWLNNSSLSIDEISEYCSMNFISVPLEKKERFTYIKSIISKIRNTIKDI